MPELDRREVLEVLVVIVGTQVLACGTPESGGTGGGGGSSNAGGSGGSGGNAGGTGGGSAGGTAGGAAGGSAGGAAGGAAGGTAGGAAGGAAGGSATCGNPILAANVATLGTGSGIQSNHTHMITIQVADITTGAMKDYTNGIGGMHTHSLRLTAADFTTLKSGGTVTKSSNNEAGDNMQHSHMVRLKCA